MRIGIITRRRGIHQVNVRVILKALFLMREAHRFFHFFESFAFLALKKINEFLKVNQYLP